VVQEQIQAQALVVVALLPTPVLMVAVQATAAAAAADTVEMAKTAATLFRAVAAVEDTTVPVDSPRLAALTLALVAVALAPVAAEAVFVRQPIAVRERDSTTAVVVAADTAVAMPVLAAAGTSEVVVAVEGLIISGQTKVIFRMLTYRADKWLFSVLVRLRFRQR
jgi:hypothetical protein